MKMIQAYVRPEKVSDILFKLSKNGFHAVTRESVLGHGKQQGLKVGDVHYDEIPKDIITVVVEDSEESKIVPIIMDTARSGKNGAYGDGKIFILPVSTAYTISSAEEKL